MKRLFLIFLAGLTLFSCSKSEKRTITVEQYVDKMKGGWLGQMIGVGWGAKTEFRYVDGIIPLEQVPAWSPEMVNAFNQDDLYVEMTFLQSMLKYGMKCSANEAAIDFANTTYGLWHANKAGRDNIRAGIAPPNSGHPQFNLHSDDIDFQIEADFAGLVSPGMPQVSTVITEKFGSFMTYGDGLYAGQFVAGMYTEAFFTKNIYKIIHAGLDCIPRSSNYAQCIVDVLNWYSKFGDDWEKVWELIDNKYQHNYGMRKTSCTGLSATNIDAKINGAFIVMGLLFGEGDLEKTIEISMRCGQDSDCNPSNAAGIIGTILGYEKIPERFKSGLDKQQTFPGTFTFDQLVQTSEKLARENVRKNGGKILEQDSKEIIRSVSKKPHVHDIVKSIQPEKISKNKFSSKELKNREIRYNFEVETYIDSVAIGWTLHNYHMAYLRSWAGHDSVIQLNTNRNYDIINFTKQDTIPEGHQSILEFKLGASHGCRGSVKVYTDKKLAKEIPTSEIPKNDFNSFQVDLSKYAGYWVDLQIDFNSNKDLSSFLYITDIQIKNFTEK